jgi:hypothetical protein
MPPIDILPIQIRPGLTVQIAGIPHDLTREEAEKIARVVMAMAMPDEVSATDAQIGSIPNASASPSQSAIASSLSSPSIRRRKSLS